MKQVIIALTTAAVVCAASASFAQNPAPKKPNEMSNGRVVIKVVREGAPSAILSGTHEVTINNGKPVKLKAGSMETSEYLTLPASEVRNLRVTFDNLACPIKSSSATQMENGTVSVIVLKLFGGKPKASAPGATKTMMGGEKPHRCEAIVSFNGKRKP